MIYNRLSLISFALAVTVSSAAQPQETELLWGDTHLHTSLSTDAFLMSNRSIGPDEAFLFAKGAPMVDPVSGAKVQLDTPLDFLVVSDHAEYMGLMGLLWTGDPLAADTVTGARFIEMLAAGKGPEVFSELLGTVNNLDPVDEFVTPAFRRPVWTGIHEAADRHNDPGRFTAFIGWEWSSIPDGQNLHRIVFMPEDSEVASQFLPYSSFDSDIESDFWAWLEETSERTGANFVAIPHNGNISNGLMFPLTDRAGNPVSVDYGNTRMRWEPVIEMTQIKGDSETHPALSPDDSFADFETFEHALVGEGVDASDAADTREGSYTRSGLLRGLQFEQQTGTNPYKYGMIGATDAHTGFSSYEEANFWGKFSLDSIPANKKDLDLLPGLYGWDMSASGLSAVWATDNSRQAITDAFKRREVYGTSGPRISLRFFGGWEFDDDSATADDIAAFGYAHGVTMGADLTAAPDGEAASFLVQAVKDPKGANLDRIQIVKGWVDEEGVTHEEVFDVAWSDRGRPSATESALPPIRSTVDLETGRYTNDVGSPELVVAWTDRHFNPDQRAFYYVRVLEIPTPRHSTLDAIALGMDPAETGHAVTIQERAYSSPIWYTP